MSNNNNNAPFHVGQRVVCVESGHTHCKSYHVFEGRFYTIKDSYNAGCNIVELNETNNAIWNPTRFAPIEPRHQDVEIAEEIKELAEQFVTGTPEISDKPKKQPAVAN